MRKIITYISIFLFISGFVGFIFNIMVSIGIINYERELPLYEIQDIQEINNYIYIGLGFYNRIQVYDLKGNYKRFIKTNNHSKNFNFSIDHFGLPKITIVPYKKLDTLFIQSSYNIKYILSNKYPLKIKKQTKLTKVTIIEQPLYMLLYSGPIIPWVISGCGILFFMFTNLVTITEVFSSTPSQYSKLKILIQKILID